MTPNQRINAYTRLILYVTVAVYAYNRKRSVLAFGAFAVVILALIHPRTHHTPLGMPMTPLQTRMVDAVPCRISSPANPFANHLLYDPADAPAACAYDIHRDAIRTNFNKGLFRDVSDPYEKQNSQRQYYTMPNSAKIPDTKAFAEFLAGGLTTRPSCKEDSSKCRGFRP